VSALRILVATDQWHPDAPGGSARLAADSARMLAGLGHRVTVLAPESRGQPRDEETGGVTVVRALRRGPVPQTLADPATTARAAARLGPADVLLAHHVTAAVGLGAAHPRTPLVLAFHGSAVVEQEFERESRGGVRPRLLAPALAAWERLAVGRAARIAAYSEFARSLLAARHPAAAARCAVVPPVVDTGRFAPEPGARARLGLEDRPLVVAGRRLEPRTGVGLLLDAAALLPGIRVVVLGAGSLLGPLREQAARRPGDRARLLGHVSEDELRDWYRAADLAVTPSLALEGFGLATVEALACGTPAAGTPVGATPELLAPLDRRLVAAAAEPRALADAIAVGLSLDEGAGSRARALAVDRFSPARAGPAWEAVLRQALER
jgi:glycosyltransferase involved in cell wall biosynthesis